MKRLYYDASIREFVHDHVTRILGELAGHHEFALEERQRDSWRTTIVLLQQVLKETEGHLVLEYSIPRMGRRIDCVLLSGGVVFALEFKVGATSYEPQAIDQVVDYALDLKNFHEQSHTRVIVPVLVCTGAPEQRRAWELSSDRIARPVLTNGADLGAIVHSVTGELREPPIDPNAWIHSGYKPTPTIVEAAQALYRGHNVQEISRSDAGAANLSRTSAAILRIIGDARRNGTKAICFLTGVPGAGKTLAGLNLANSWHNPDHSEHAVFLSGNGPLVEVLREALARDDVAERRNRGERASKRTAISKAKAFIQNIHHFRDDMLATNAPPIEHVVVFDEAQRAWTVAQTANFMRTKKGIMDFTKSEPEFLIGAMDRHRDWATIVCLVGAGQEINKGEAGLPEWFEALRRTFGHWQVYVSPNLTDDEYTRGQPLWQPADLHRIHFDDHLHLSVSVRSFRSERVAAFVKALLDLQIDHARSCWNEMQDSYPIVLTRDLAVARRWLREQARGSERYGIVASSGAIRLRPEGIHVKSDIDPVNWFLNGKQDIRSSYYLEEVATEFDIQGLELDWTCVAWDADMRYSPNGWVFKVFRGARWEDVGSDDARLYAKNAYRVLLTRARQGMVIFVPRGDRDDPTRPPEFYDATFEYLASLGIPVLA
ncbi:MAG: DUF2075 domain-containing protein [Chthonomonadales bacterium]|nr:DUF2075 domain-containing protein [Chthonomonadales bacterium]